MDSHINKLLLAHSRRKSKHRIPAIRLCHAGLLPSRANGEHDVECRCCSLKLKNLHHNHSPLVWHWVYSRSCPFLAKEKHFPTSNSLQNEPRITTAAATAATTAAATAAATAASGDNTGEAINVEELSKTYQRLNELRHQIPVEHMKAISTPTETAHGLSSSYELWRRQTFSEWPKQSIVSPRALAKSGFIHIHNMDESEVINNETEPNVTVKGRRQDSSEDIVQCVFCKVHISEWTADMVPDVVHRKQSKDCPLMKGYKTVLNVPDLMSDILDEGTTALPADDSHLGIITEATNKHPDFTVEARRKATFLTWPHTSGKKASEMIEHALFYTGTGDVVCCFSCGIEMSGWTSTDNIWRRHVRQAPHCQLVIQEKGADWVAATIKEHGLYREPEPAITYVTESKLRHALYLPATQRFLQLVNPSYSLQEELKAVLRKNIQDGGPDFKSTADIVKAILKQRDAKRQTDAEEKALATEPAPPQVVSPIRRPAEGEGRAVTDLPNQAGNEAASAVEAPVAQGLPTGAAAILHRPPMDNVQDMERRNRGELRCVVCEDSPHVHPSLPCGHLVFCISCESDFEQCALCYEDIRGYDRNV